MKVGDTLYIRRYRHGDEIIEATVTKVGRKYFEVDKIPRTRFVIDSMLDDTISSHSYRCYRSMQEIKDENERSRLMSEIRRYFSELRPKQLPLEDVRKIAKLIGVTT